MTVIFKNKKNNMTWPLIDNLPNQEAHLVMAKF